MTYLKDMSFLSLQQIKQQIGIILLCFLLILIMYYEFWYYIASQFGLKLIYHSNSRIFHEFPIFRKKLIARI